MPPLRPRKAKPPPGIITAGGVDMARAHASGIKLRDQSAQAPIVDQPRVVLAVETDPRKVPTHKRLVEGREPAADGTRAALLPGGSIHATPPSGVKAPSAPPARAVAPSRAASATPAVPVGTAPQATPARQVPVWMRAALVLTLLVFVGGIAQRFRDRVESSEAEGPASAPSFVTQPPDSPVPNVAPPRQAQSAPPPVVVEAPRAPVPVPVTAAPVTAAPTTAAPTVAPPNPRPPSAQPVKPPPAAPASSRATFTPPFQLPGEKN